MPANTDIHVVAAQLYWLAVECRMPIKFGAETLDRATCARVRLEVEDRLGRRAVGWGETPLAVQWVWPSTLSYEMRLTQLQQFCLALVNSWVDADLWGHPLEIGADFQEHILNGLLEHFNAESSAASCAMPYLAALVCDSPFDLALYDAYGNLHQRGVYETYRPPYLNRDLSVFLTDADGSAERFQGRFPVDYLQRPPPVRLPVWHLVGGVDPLDKSDIRGDEPDDGYPVLLTDWINRDGLKCLKVKLRGTDANWDFERLVRVGGIALDHGVSWLSADFNCMVSDPAYVHDVLDRLSSQSAAVYDMLLYIEQPFPYDLDKHRIDVQQLSGRKPLFMDESAHDWRLVRLGRSLGWSGVALKTCKTQTGAILSLCWAKEHNMALMVQDLANPMLAQISHVQLAAHAGTIMGVECNAMQFYPAASLPEAAVHPGLYRRRHGQLDLSTIGPTGFGYRLDEINRALGAPQAAAARADSVSFSRGAASGMQCRQ